MRTSLLARTVQAGLDALDKGALPALVMIAAGAAAVGAAVAVVSVLLSATAPVLIASACLVLAIAAAVVGTRPEPLRVLFLATLPALPVSALLLPLRSWEVSAFDGVMVFVLAAALWRQFVARPLRRPEPFVPSLSFKVALLLTLPVALLAQFPWQMTLALFDFAGIYGFFLMAYRELDRRDGFERLVALWCVGTILLALGAVFERTTGMNLSFDVVNFNTVEGHGGAAIRRIGGFFQDPQKSAQYFGCTLAFTATLLLRRRFEKRATRTLLLAASLLGAYAMMLSVSRIGTLASLGVTLAFALLFNGWRLFPRLAVYGVVAVIAAGAAALPGDALVGLLPSGWAERLGSVNESAAGRTRIWFDTWDMFADHPMVGIGPGNFAAYLIKTRPTVLNFYGIGAGTREIYVPDQPESGYLKIFYEGGVLGSCAALILVADALRRVARARKAAPRRRTELIAAFAALLVFGISFTTLFTLSDPRNAIALILPFAIIWHRTRKASTLRGRRPLPGEAGAPASPAGRTGATSAASPGFSRYTTRTGDR